jgi:hypothetical protein
VLQIVVTHMAFSMIYNNLTTCNAKIRTIIGITVTIALEVALVTLYASHVRDATFHFQSRENVHYYLVAYLT